MSQQGSRVKESRSEEWDFHPQLIIHVAYSFFSFSHFLLLPLRGFYRTLVSVVTVCPGPPGPPGPHIGSGLESVLIAYSSVHLHLPVRKHCLIFIQPCQNAFYFYFFAGLRSGKAPPERNASASGVQTLSCLMFVRVVEVLQP